MDNFNIILHSFENTNNTCEFYDIYSDDRVSTRFLLIRSLDKPHLLELLDNANIKANKSDKIHILMEKVFNSKITIDDILSYIDLKRKEVLSNRLKDEKNLQKLINGYPTVNCGIRNDKVDDLVKQLVRDKSIENLEQLNSKIDSQIDRIRQYIMWSFYNQATNDLIEHIILKNDRIIPTLRKIPNIDFFVKINDEIIPFDLKVTHISDAFFNLFSNGLKNSNGPDDFESIKNGTSEIQQLKDFYKDKKKLWNLPNYGSLNKTQIIDILQNVNKPEANKFIDTMLKNRTELVSNLEEHLHELEWWNYKFQGERLFCNNNRLFIFLAYSNSFEDAKALKGNLDAISEKLNKLLNNLTESDLHTINYYYEKDTKLTGSYCAKSTSILIVDEK